MADQIVWQNIPMKQLIRFLVYLIAHTLTPPKREEREPTLSIHPVALELASSMVTLAPLHAPGSRAWLTESKSTKYH